MAIIQSGSGTNLLTIDGISKAARVTLYDAGGNLISSLGDVALLAQTLGSLNSSVTLNLSGQAGAAVQIIGTTGTVIINFEATVDDVNWFSINGVAPTTGNISNYTSTDGQWLLAIAGYTAIRCRVSYLISGSMTISIRASQGSQLSTEANTVPISINQGTPTSINNSWPVSITDGYNIIGTSLHPVIVDISGNNTQPISAASLPLPTGAATESTLTTLLSNSTFTSCINTLGQKTSVSSTPVVLASDQSAIPSTQSGIWNVGGTGNFTIVQPTAANLNATVVGTVTSNIGTTGGLSLDSTLTNGTQTTRITDGTNTVSVKAASTAAGATDKALVVAVSPNNSVAVTGTFFQATQPVSGTITANAGTGTFSVSASSLPLPSGASTESTLGTRLADSTFTGRINILGQKTMSGSTPVVLASDQSSVSVMGSGSFTVAQATAANLNATVTGTVAATQSGTWTVQPGNTANTTPWLSTINQGGNSATVSAGGALKVDGSSVTQPVSGTITANAGAGTFAILGTVTSNIGTTNGLALDTTLTGGTQRNRVTDGTNNAAVKASSTAAAATDPALVVAISPNNSVAVTGTFFQATQPVSGTITSNIGTTNGLALDSTLSKLTIAQSAALDTNTQVMVAGSVTTVAPTYVTGNINPLSLTTAGALRVDGSNTVQPISGTVAATQSGTWTVQPGNTANTTPWLSTINQGGNSATVSVAGALKIDGSATTQPISGTITANASKDLNRVVKIFNATNIAGVTTEGLITLTPLSDFVVGTTGTSFTVTSGKKLRLQALMLTWRSTTAAAGTVTTRLRISNTGAVTTATNITTTLSITQSTATIGFAQTQSITFPDGLELSGTMQLGITQISSATTSGFDISLIAWEY